MHVLTICLRVVRPEARVIEAVLGMTILTVVGLSTRISLLPLVGIVGSGRAWLLSTGGRSVIALRVLIVGLRGGLTVVSFEDDIGVEWFPYAGRWGLRVGYRAGCGN